MILRRWWREAVVAWRERRFRRRQAQAAQSRVRRRRRAEPGGGVLARAEPSPAMNDQTLKLLEKALRISPEDWETRAHLIEASLEQSDPARAEELLRAAPRCRKTSRRRS